MKNRVKYNPLLRVFMLLSALVFIGIVIAIFLYYYYFSIPEPEGISLASWPQNFTNDFEWWISYEEGEISVKDSGLKRLNEYGLWVQILDENGQEVFMHNKPADYPERYLASELMGLQTSKYQNGYTLFTSHTEKFALQFSYIIGFPYPIGKSILYYDAKNLDLISDALYRGVLISFSILLMLILSYGIWLSRRLSIITSSIHSLFLRKYYPLKERGTFRMIFTELNKIDQEIEQSDQLKKETENMRKEWISNITHDLKTPLSPVKGYAELIADDHALEIRQAKKYGAIILKNVSHMERLIDDLKLTYQLDSKSLPYNPQPVKFLCYLKEIIIDIINDPTLTNRDVWFESEIKEIILLIDAPLFRRAIRNLIMNALMHNPANTQVKVSIHLETEQLVCISVCDNGVGIGKEEQAKIFERYYRGTNTQTQSEGTGLGLAIAKQVVLLHNGTIHAESQIGVGTTFVITLPVGE